MRILCKTLMYEALVVGGLVLPVAGCGNTDRDPDTEQQRAEQALAMALDIWKSGGTTDDLRRERPAIVVGDLDWSAGGRLLDYRLGERGAFDGRNLRMPVTLVLQSPRGGRRRRVDTSYIVGVDPVITVIRESE